MSRINVINLNNNEIITKELDSFIIIDHFKVNDNIFVLGYDKDDCTSIHLYELNCKLEILNHKENNIPQNINNIFFSTYDEAVVLEDKKIIYTPVENNSEYIFVFNIDNLLLQQITEIEVENEQYIFSYIF